MELDGDPEPQVPALSAGYSRNSRKNKKKKKKKPAKRIIRPIQGGRTRKLKYRDMVLNAIKATGEIKGSNFNKIASFVERKYRMKNDFIVKHTLKWLCEKKILLKSGGKYKLLTPICLPSAGRRTRKKSRGGKSRKRRGKKSRRKSSGGGGGKKKKKKGGKKKGKKGGGKAKKGRKGGKKKKGKGRKKSG